MSNILNDDIPVSPIILLLNDMSSIMLTYLQKIIILAGLTAAKRMLALCWQPPHTLSILQWANIYLEVINMELSVAKMHGSNGKTSSSWAETSSKVQLLQITSSKGLRLFTYTHQKGVFHIDLITQSTNIRLNTVRYSVGSEVVDSLQSLHCSKHM